MVGREISLTLPLTVIILGEGERGKGWGREGNILACLPFPGPRLRDRDPCVLFFLHLDTHFFFFFFAFLFGGLLVHKMPTWVVGMYS